MLSMRPTRRLLLPRYLSRFAAAASFFAAVPALYAQGGLSIQGFGFPGGELSSRALATGGSLADFDANSPINPASLLVGTRATVYLQYDPEFRWITGPGFNSSQVTARFPIFMISGRIGKARFSLSYANYLDRTWTNTYKDTTMFGATPVPSTVTVVSTGGISDARAAMSYTFSPKLTIGVGIHQFPGGTQSLYGRTFPADSTAFGAFAQTSSFNFSGSAMSFGMLATPFTHWNFGLSGRVGFTMRLHRGDSTTLAEAKVPNRFSVSAAFDGITGTILTARFASEQFSAMNGLSAHDLTIFDSKEYAGGLETAGPKFGGVPSAVRLGFRSRGLPFGVGTSQVTENSFTGGIGIPLSLGRAALDISLARASRSAPSIALSEKSWILSVGVSIKPYF